MESIGQIWTTETVIARLREAADTLRRLPFPKGGKPPGLKAAWPDVVADYWTVYAKHKPKMRLAAAEPGAILRMDEALQWILWIERDQRIIVWAKASGFSWREIAKLHGGGGRSTLQRRHDKAVALIIARLINTRLDPKRAIRGAPGRLFVSLAH